MAAPALYRDSDGGVKQFSTASLRETTMNIQGIEPLAVGTDVALFDTLTANLTMGSALGADNTITIGPTAGPNILIDNDSTTPLITLDGDVAITGDETVTGNAVFNGNTQIGDVGEGDTLTVYASSQFYNNVTLGESTTGGDVITFLGKSGTEASVVFTDAQIGSDVPFDGSARQITNAGANLTIATTGTADLNLTGGDHVVVTTGTAAGDAFYVNTDALYVDGENDYVIIGDVTALPASPAPAPLTVYQDTINYPAVSLSSGGTVNTTLCTGSTNPDTVVSAPTGSLFLRNTGKLYVKTSTTGTSWAEIGTTASSDLQAAYDAGNTIEMTSGRDLIFETFDAATISNFIVRHAAGADNFIATNSTAATTGSLDLGSTNVTINVLNGISMTGTTRTIDSTSANLTLQTLTTGNIILDSVGAVGVGTSTPQANSMMTVAHNVDRMVSLQNTTDSSIADICSGTSVTGVIAGTGSLYLEADTTGANGKLYLNQSAGGFGSTWTEISTDASVTLNDAYQNGQTITLDGDTYADLVITVDEAAVVADFTLTGSTNGDYLSTDATNTKLVLGSDGTTDVTVDVAAQMNFTGTDRIINSTSANLDITTTTGGDINVNSVAELDLDGGTSVVIDSGTTMALTATTTFDATAGANNNLTLTTSGTGEVNLVSADEIDLTTSGSGQIDLNSAAGVLIDAAAASNFTVAGANLTLQTTTSGDVVIDSAAGVDIDSTTTIDLLATTTFSIDGTGASNVSATSGNLTLSTLTSGDVLLTSAGDIDLSATGGEVTLASGTAEVMSILTGTNDPSSVATTANAGSLFLRDDTSTGEVYVKQDDGSSTNWLQLATINEVGDVVMTALSLAESFDVGDVLYMDTTGSVGKASGDSTETAKARPLGICLTDNTVGTAGNTIRIALAGEVIINSAVAAGSEGKYLYLSDTAGALLLTPPSGSGDTVIRCGTCTLDGAAGTAKMSISFGEPTLL